MAGVGGLLVEGSRRIGEAQGMGAGSGGRGEKGDTDPVKLSRLAAAGGVAGPVLFTVAWVAGSLRQAGHSAAEVQLSGLAAEDARNLNRPGFCGGSQSTGEWDDGSSTEVSGRAA